MSFWDRLTVVTFVLNPVLTAMCCCDGMKGGTFTLVYSLLLQSPTRQAVFRAH